MTLLAEIDEQPAVIARLLEQQAALVRQLAELIDARSPRALVLVARGSSDNAAVYGRYLFEIRNRMLTSLAAPSSVTVYESGPRLDETVVIGVSQSGQGEDVVAYVQGAREQGALTVAIVNDETSPLAESAEWVVGCLAGPELSVPATKTVTAQMTVLAMLSAALESDAGFEGLSRVAAAVGSALGLRGAASDAVSGLIDTTNGSVVGRGFAFPPALEIALKLKETSYAPAEPFSAADFFHGPLALVEPGYGAVVVDVGGRSTAGAVQVATAVQQRGGEVVMLRAGEIDPLPATLRGLTLRVAVSEVYAPMVAVVLGQLLAVELAAARGLDPANPRGLRKVTSTR